MRKTLLILCSFEDQFVFRILGVQEICSINPNPSLDFSFLRRRDDFPLVKGFVSCTSLEVLHHVHPDPAFHVDANPALHDEKLNSYLTARHLSRNPIQMRSFNHEQTTRNPPMTLNKHSDRCIIADFFPVSNEW